MSNAIKTVLVLLGATLLIVGCSLALKDRQARTYVVPYEQQQEEDCTCVRIEPE